MEKTIQVLLGLFLLLFGIQVSADNYDGTMDVFESAPELQPYFDNAFGYAVFPTVGKLGIGIGAALEKVGSMKVIMSSVRFH